MLETAESVFRHVMLKPGDESWLFMTDRLSDFAPLSRMSRLYAAIPGSEALAPGEVEDRVVDPAHSLVRPGQPALQAPADRERRRQDRLDAVETGQLRHARVAVRDGAKRHLVGGVDRAPLDDDRARGEVQDVLPEPEEVLRDQLAGNPPVDDLEAGEPESGRLREPGGETAEAERLAAALGREFGMVVDKGPQRADWSQRPLPPELEAYAAQDVAMLIALQRRLEAALVAAGRLDWVIEECEALVAQEPTHPSAPHPPDPAKAPAPPQPGPAPPSEAGPPVPAQPGAERIEERSICGRGRLVARRAEAR